MKTHEVEKLLGITKQALIYYEKENLINPSRDENNYRNYNEDDLRLLKLILMLRSLDLSIDEIKLILNNQLSIRAALENKKEFINQSKLELIDIDQKIDEYIKRNRVKVSFNQQSLKNWVDKETLFANEDGFSFKGIVIDFKQINQIKLSICSEVYPIDLLKIYLNYYIDFDIETVRDTFSFQILNNQAIKPLFDYLQKHQLKIDDPLNLVEVYQKNDLVMVEKYLNHHFRKWAQKYHLDNPRTSVTGINRFIK